MSYPSLYYHYYFYYYDGRFHLATFICLLLVSDRSIFEGKPPSRPFAAIV